ncbi:hypothetical protein MHYP_G00060010 [Metynnis hypsauchen]
MTSLLLWPRSELCKANLKQASGGGCPSPSGAPLKPPPFFQRASKWFKFPIWVTLVYICVSKRQKQPVLNSGLKVLWKQIEHYFPSLKKGPHDLFTEIVTEC